MSDFNLLNINDKVRNYKLTDDFIKMAEQKLKENKEKRTKLIGECHHELLLNIGSKDTWLIGEEKIMCLVCNSCFAKDSEKQFYNENNVIDISFLNNINVELFINEAKKYLIELYEEYQNKLSIDEIKYYLLNYLIEFNQFLDEQNLKEMDDEFEEDTYEIMRDYQRKVREKRTNKSS